MLEMLSYLAGYTTLALVAAEQLRRNSLGRTEKPAQSTGQQRRAVENGKAPCEFVFLVPTAHDQEDTGLIIYQWVC
mgnify:CR=1 FL=1